MNVCKADAVCKQPDDFTKELEVDCQQALWRAELSNGEIIIQDDSRPGCDPPQAWLRLATYLQQTTLRIVNLWIQFRSNSAKDILPKNADGYFFCKRALGNSAGGATYHSYLLGALVDGKLTVQTWHVPELVLDNIEEREPEKAGVCLILNGAANVEG